MISKEDIQAAKEKLGDRNADMIADILQLEKYNPQRRVGCCPNPNHEDSTPSFSYNPKSYSFLCFGCRINVDIIDAYMRTGHTFLEACEKLFEAADMPHAFADRGVKSDRDYYYPEPEYAENKERVYQYWERRKISRATVDYLGMQQDPRGNTLFQYYDLNDVLRCVKVRPSEPVHHGRPKCWWLKDSKGTPYDTMHLLFNMNRINVDAPLIICCGEGDCATAIECGFTNAVSIAMGDGNTQWIAHQWEWLQGFNEIILVHDNDESGRKFVNEVSRRLGEYRIKVVDVPEVAKDLDGKEIRVKDLNEYLFYCGADAVRDVINNARESAIPSLVDYTEISKFNMSDVPGFVSGFKELDELLERFYVGTVNIITGVASSGKSSLLSTLVDMSIEQGYPAFIYSGELSNALLRSWIDYVHAGQEHLEKRVSKSFTYYSIKQEAIAKMNSYYKGQLYFYKDSENNKASSIMATMEAAVRRYGVKTCVIDNMTSIDLENDDNNKWVRQDEFIRDVIDFAKRWGVVVFVVLHPRKMDTVRRMSLFDLQGVVSSVNLSHRVFSLYRIQDSDRHGEKGRDGSWRKKPLRGDVMLDVLKDRYGSASNRSVSLYYDRPSKRFYDTPETLSFRYAWENDESKQSLPFFDEKQYYNDVEVFGPPDRLTT